MKDVSDSIDHFKQLRGRENCTKEVDSELTLAAASAQRLSLHVNAWTMPQLSQELERIWLQAVRAEAKVDPQFQHLVTEWERASEALEKFISTTHVASVDKEAEQDAMATKIRDCQLRAGIEPKTEKAGWWKQRQRRFLWDELRHIERKVAPMASPSRLASRSAPPQKLNMAGLDGVQTMRAMEVGFKRHHSIGDTICFCYLCPPWCAWLAADAKRGASL